MKKKKIILEDLKIESFLTSSYEELSKTEGYLGGGTTPTAGDSCTLGVCCLTSMETCPSSPTSASDYDCP